MKRTLFLLAFAATALFADNAKALFESKCMGCHIATKPTPELRAKMVAPPAFGVMFHVKERYKDRKDAIEFIVSYAMKPDRNKSVCMPRTIKRFGLMPSMKGSVSESELEAIAGYMYDNFPPEWFSHPKQSGGCNGKKGCASGSCGKNRG